MKAVKAFKYRIYPNKGQEQKLLWTLEQCRFLYNCALEQRIRAYKSQGVSVGYHEQAVSLPEVKEALPEFKQIHSQVLQDTLKRLDKAYQAFFARLKRGDKAGFPRFQGRNRFDSITYPQYQGKPTARSVYLPKIGNVRIKLHRELEGKVKTCTVKRDRCGDWYVVFSCEITAQAVTQPDKQVGIDAGLKHIVVTSEGKKLPSPKYSRKAEARLRRVQQKLARREQASKAREKAGIAVAKLHRKVQRQRDDFLHKLAVSLLREYDVIVIEALNLKGLASGFLAKSFHDVAIGKLQQLLEYKAGYAGKQVLKVDPRYTTQDCSSCGYRDGKKPLSVRTWTCSKCKATHDRDINAAINILARFVPLSADSEPRGCG
ncbi:MAG: RNA-guided endonuclease TnpB family protein [Deinococcales bacterium]